MGERQFGPYRLVHQIAVGGMAEIYLAKTRGIAGFEKYVALKMIHPNFSQDEQFVEMLIDEAKISVQLQHANIAQTFDLGRVDQTYYITMEFVDGADLYKILRRAAERNIAMPVDVAAFIAKEMANGLDYAHRRRDLAGQALGIVHRDVSPQNVLISHAGEVKLVDFGIAKATMKARQTAVGVIKGKYYYMSPEQAWGDRVDHRTDIFSTGVCLYEALTGRMLYQEEELQRLLQQVRKAEIASPTTRRRDIPPQLERIVMRSLASGRDERYQNAGDMATDLERFLHVYSPVFTASKLAEFFRSVLAEEEPPTTKRPVLPKRPAPQVPMHTMRLEPDQILSDSAELSDENSIIFDLGRPGSESDADQGGFSPPPMHTVSTSAHTLAGVPLHDAQSADDLDNIEEQTMVSGPPGFGGGGGGGNLGNFEPTLVGTGFDDSPNFDEGETEGGGDIGDIHGEPTLLQNDNSDLQRRLREANNMPGARPAGPPPRPQQPVRSGAGGKRAPANPVLAASTPKPAVSLTGPAKRSRKTPAEGAPAEPSLLAALVPKDGEQPVRREMPQTSPQGEATLPARPGGAAALAQTQQAPVAGMQPGAPMQPGMQPGMQPQAAWPGAYPGVPNNGGYAPGGFAQQQYSPLPMGQAPTSFTKQLQQLELRGDSRRVQGRPQDPALAPGRGAGGSLRRRGRRPRHHAPRRRREKGSRPADRVHAGRRPGHGQRHPPGRAHARASPGGAGQALRDRVRAGQVPDQDPRGPRARGAARLPGARDPAARAHLGVDHQPAGQRRDLSQRRAAGPHATHPRQPRSRR